MSWDENFLLSGDKSGIKMNICQLLYLRAAEICISESNASGEPVEDSWTLSSAPFEDCVPGVPTQEEALCGR